jgi:hypothetical protein
MENLNIQLVRPPIAVGASACVARERALAYALVVSFCVHVFLHSRSVAAVQRRVGIPSLGASGLSGPIRLQAGFDKISLST